MEKLKKICVVITVMMTIILSASAQNLTAAQMNIYFGSPKKVILTNSQGTTITEFDRKGRITKVIQGNMSVKYEWSEDGENVILSMYQGANYQESGYIEIRENTPSKLNYVVGEMVTMDVSFKSNGALEKAVMDSPQMSGAITYLYYNENDAYPYAIDQSVGNQSAKCSIIIEELDSYGNAIVFTQEFMGNKDVTRLTIDYY